MIYKLFVYFHLHVFFSKIYVIFRIYIAVQLLLLNKYVPLNCTVAYECNYKNKKSLHNITTFNHYAELLNCHGLISVLISGFAPLVASFTFCVLNMLYLKALILNHVLSKLIDHKILRIMLKQLYYYEMSIILYYL